MTTRARARTRARSLTSTITSARCHFCSRGAPVPAFNTVAKSLNPKDKPARLTTVISTDSPYFRDGPSSVRNALMG
jgi:hypothetical protein